MQAAGRSAGWLVLLSVFATDGWAGLSLERALERQRSLVRAERGEPEPPPAAGSTALTLGLGEPEDDIPRMLAPEIGREGPALRLRHEWAFGEPGERLRPRFTLGLTAGPGGSATEALEGSVLAWPTGPNSEMYASVESRHWGPGWTGSLIMDGASSPVAAVGWRRPRGGAFESRWLSWLGPWRADLFAGQLRGHSEPADPWLIGLRAEIEPLPGLQLGASRGIQWGGQGRPETLSALLNALIGRDNFFQGEKENEPGNQLAGVDARYRFPLASASHLSLYGQAIGEDENRALPTAFMFLLGSDVSIRRGSTDWRGWFEWTNTIAGEATGRPRPGAAYDHFIYRQGYTNAGRPIGAPVGGDVKLGSLGLLADAGRWGGSIGLHGGRAGEKAQRFEPRARLLGADAALSLQLDGRNRAGLSAWVWRAGDEHDGAMQVWWQHAWP